MLGKKSFNSNNTLGHKSKVSNATFGKKQLNIKSMVYHPIQEDTTPKKSDLEKYHNPHPHP